MPKRPIIFMGSPAVAVTILEALLQAGHDIRAVVTQPDKPSGRGQKLSPPPVKAFAAARGLEVLQPLKVKTPEFAEALRRYEAQVLVVAAYGRILSQEILDVTPHPLNVHFSLLPQYRGASCVASAILNDEKETGVTIMRVVEALDAGPILSQERLEIRDEDTTESLEAKLATMGGELLVRTLERLDTLPGKPQEEAQATYAPLLKKEDGLIDWAQSARRIFNQVRAFQPWPVAHTRIDNQRLRIYGAKMSEAAGPAGAICSLSDAGIEVACGQGSLLLTEIQPEGKNRMSARDFLNGLGRKLKTGQTL